MRMSKTDRLRSLRGWLSVAICALVAGFVFIGVVLRLFEPKTEFVVQVGVNAFRMFTVLSNLLLAVCALLAIPYAVDGIRHRSFHMPRWIVCALYMGATSVTITFLVTVAILSPFAGLKYMLFHGSHLFLHTLAPLLGIVLFVFVATSHRVTRRQIVLAMLPVLLYTVVYVLEVFIIGEERGGWADHYRFGVYLPWPLTLIILMIVCTLIAIVLRLAHNKIHARVRKMDVECDKRSPDFDYPTIEEAVSALAAKARARENPRGNIIVPRRKLALMKERFGCEREVSELCTLYVQCYTASADTRKT